MTTDRPRDMGEPRPNAEPGYIERFVMPWTERYGLRVYAVPVAATAAGWALMEYVALPGTARDVLGPVTAGLAVVTFLSFLVIAESDGACPNCHQLAQDSWNYCADCGRHLNGGGESGGE